MTLRSFSEEGWAVRTIMKKTLLIIAGVALALAAVAIVHNNREVYPTAPATTTVATTSAPLPIVDNVTLKAGTKTYSAHIEKSESVLDLMRSLVSTSSFTFTGKDYPSLGFFVESIDGKRNGDGKYWILYVNGKSSDLGASNATIHAGDTVEWRFEKSY